MKKAEKKRRGFSLVELVIVIAVMAILAVLAGVAFRGVRRNAQVSALNADANALVGALNNYNAQSMTPFAPAVTVTVDLINAHANGAVAGSVITFTVPARGVQAAMTFPVSFDSVEQMNRALYALEFSNNFFRVNSGRVSNPTPAF